MRLSYEELNEIKKKHNVNELWSYSKYSTYLTSHYEWLLKYVKKVKEDNEKQSAYGVLGSVAHDSLENFYNEEMAYDELANNFDDAFTVNIDIAGLCFDRCDSEKNNNIKNKYYVNIMEYFKNFKPIPYKCTMEDFVLIKVTDDIVFNGYMDCVFVDDDGVYNIVDFKTSTKFTSSSMKEHSAQLALYAEGMRQRGIPRDKIKCAFYFLKYVDIDCEQINGKIKTRTIERYDIGNKLQASVKSWMKKLGYDEETTFDTIDKMVQSNSIDVLPEDVRSKYTINDCITYVDDIWDFYDALKDEIIENITEIRSNVEKYNILNGAGKFEEAEHLFWDDDERLKTQSYYYNNLCGYSISTIKPYKGYLDRITAEKEGSIFGVRKPKTEEDDSSVNTSAEMDMSWLDAL